MSGTVGALLLATGIAEAERNMVVVLDATGSMTLGRIDGKTRFEAAKEQAVARIDNARGETAGLTGGVTVYTFSTTGLTRVTDVAATPFDAAQAIMALTPPSGLTPLAGSLCDAIDRSNESGNAATTARLLEVFSDGEENFTDSMHDCYGPPSADADPPFELGSWQNKVYQYRGAHPLVTINVTLYHNVAVGGFAATASADPEQALLGTSSPFSTFATRLSDADFFAALAAASGGTFHAIADNEPLPVFGDVDGDYDVDRDDAIALARQFGAPATHAFDLDADNTIGWGDYAILLGRLGTGSGTPAPDPYTQAGVVRCGNDDTVVIDGKVIEGEGLTIETRSKCNIVIRNSLIVSGSSALRFSGSARVTVDNSVIVGAGAWVSGNGSVMLSAAGSVFHGAQAVSGTVKYTDRGGNVFER